MFFLHVNIKPNLARETLGKKVPRSVGNYFEKFFESTTYA